MTGSDKILLLGGTGFLGSRIKYKNRKIIAPTHGGLDLLNVDNVYKFIEKSKPTSIIYSAGISKIDFAEKNKTLTNILNYKIPTSLAKFSLNNNIKFIYVSTDAVFDGYKKKFEFLETDKTNAKSVYGISKEKAEFSITSISENNSVVRLINLFGLGNENNFLYRMMSNLKKGKEFEGIVDQVNNPLNVDIAAESILWINKNNLKGIYNLGATNSSTNYDFLVLAAKEMKLNSELIKKIKFDDFLKNKKAHRKKRSVLITNKFHSASSKTLLKNIKNSIAYLNRK